MNKYTATGLALAARAGKRILVLSHNRDAARHAMDHFAPTLGEDTTVRRTHGGERITWASGGSISFRSHRSNLRGHSADTVYIDWDAEVDHNAHASDFYDNLKKITAGSPAPEIIRA